MTYNEARNLLGQQKWRLENNEGFEAWLDTAEHYVNDIFGISSKPAANFRELKSDYRISKIRFYDDRQWATHENNFRLRAKQQITGLIVYLTEKEALERKEQERERQKELNESEAQRKLKATEPIAQSDNTKPVRNGWFKKIGLQFMSLKIQAWSIIIGTWISGMFGMYKVGYDVGSSKFDKDKNEFYQKNQVLENTVKAMGDTIQSKSDSIQLMLSIIKQQKK